jgi:hypothetical protein
MRPIALWLLTAALTAGAFAPLVAQAQEVDVTFKSRYVDTETFNDVFSNEPSLQAEASYNITDTVYISAYAYTGFIRTFADNSSEFGGEIGGSWDIAPDTTFDLAAGRYADYEGQGFAAGDWYAKAAVTYGHLSVSGSVLQGVSDTVLLRTSYELPVTSRLTLTPSVVYLTATGDFNPALQAKYRLTDTLSIGAGFVFPKNDITGKRKLYGAVGLTKTF